MLPHELKLKYMAAQDLMNLHGLLAELLENSTSLNRFSPARKPAQRITHDLRQLFAELGMFGLQGFGDTESDVLLP